MRVAVYTARIGRTDALEEPSYVAPGVTYICATDGEIPEGSAWQRREVTAGADSAMTARRFKISLHEEATSFDYYVWQDCRFSLAVDPLLFVPMLMRADLLVMPHPFCSSLEAEAHELKRRELVDAQRLDQQLELYRQKRFDVSGSPHSSTGLLVRRNDKRTDQFNRSWLEELECFGHARDQMSFDFAAWKTGMLIGYLEGEYRDNPWAIWRVAA